MTAGDTFMVTYTGHGGQVPNSDVDVDPEADSKDETWVCYDRQLIDDELWRAWQEFDVGVNIIVISDSCHSGTIARMFLGSRAVGEVAEEIDRVRAETYVLKKAYYANLTVPRPGLDEPASPASRQRTSEFAWTDMHGPDSRSLSGSGTPMPAARRGRRSRL